MCHGKLVRLTLHIINFLIWVCSVLLIVFGAIGVASPSTTISMLSNVPGVSYITYIFTTAQMSPYLLGTSIFMIVLGSILFLYTIFACIAVHKGNEGPSFMMKMYWLSLICGFLAEVALMIFSGVYPETMAASIQNNMFTNLVANFKPVTVSGIQIIPQPDDSAAGAWELLQFQGQCCGANSFTDYYFFASTWKPVGYLGVIPPTCCAWNSGVTENNLNQTTTSQAVNYPGCTQTSPPANNSYSTTPCSDVVLNALFNFNFIAMGLAAALLVIQMLSTILAILLRKCDSTEYV